MEACFKDLLKTAGRDETRVDLMRCDLHVHSWHSGPADLPVLSLLGRECYSDPRAVYDQALTRGMDLVTLTDHDSIQGAVELLSLPNTFLSEEVTVLLPAGRQLHLCAFDITEAQHEGLQRRRTDADALFAYLAEERIPASVNHLFSALTGRREVSDFHLALDRVGLIEALNGAMPEAQNEYARLVGRAAGKAPVGGSDAHSVASVGRAFTTVAGARSREDFLEGLRRGLTVPAGQSGSYARLTADVVRIFAAGYVEGARGAIAGLRPALRFAATLALVPLLPLIPLVTAALHLRERRFGNGFFRRFEASWGAPIAPVRKAPLSSGAALRSLGQARG
jgi:predicted metal-dependent phosphoesterase TrpH